MRFLNLFLVIFLFSSSIGTCFSAANIELWPITQSIMNHKNNSVLWIKNLNNSSVSLQIRVFKWQQKDNKNVLTSENNIFPDPPFLIVGPHKQVAVRLFINNSQVKKSYKENAYRIIINQLPSPNITKNKTNDTDSINIRMEYILPLFVYGDAIQKNILPGINGIPREHHTIKWGIRDINGIPLLYITNCSLTHIRLIDLTIKNGKTTIFSDSPKNNYILPEATLTFPINNKIKLNANDTLIISEPYSHNEAFSYQRS